MIRYSYTLPGVTGTISNNHHGSPHLYDRSCPHEGGRQGCYRKFLVEMLIDTLVEMLIDTRRVLRIFLFSSSSSGYVHHTATYLAGLIMLHTCCISVSSLMELSIVGPNETHRECMHKESVVFLVTLPKI